jgi:RNA polymerase sigma-70 factor (ECF subfamily)
MIKQDNISQEEALQLLCDNKEASFSRLYNFFWPSLFSSAYKRLKDKAACEDIVQNVFTDLWFRKDKVEITNLSAYLHAAVRYQVYKRSIRLNSDHEFIKGWDGAIESSLKADDELRFKELSGLVELWIAALPGKRRRIFIMHYYESLSTREIAQKLDISQKTVQNQLNNAASEIRSRFSYLFMLMLVVITNDQYTLPK